MASRRLTRRRKARVSSFEIILVILALGFITAGIFLFTDGRTGVSRTDVMEQRLRNLKQMKTVSQSYRSVIYVEEKNFWRGNKRVLFTIQYHVTAGVDFSKGLKIRELPDGSIQVVMPSAEVFFSDADESSIHQMYLRENPYLNPIRMSDYMSQIVAQGEANQQAALDSGILDFAETNARLAILQILKLGGFEKVVFEKVIFGEVYDGR